MALSRPASSALLLLAALVWLGLLGVRPLYKPDEARYGEIPREMAASGDWVTPRLNGYKYFEKPPLQYWATALAYRMFGVSDWSARLWTGLAALAGVAMVFGAGNRLFGPPAGAFAAALLASTPLYLLLGQGNTLDMGLTFFLTLAVLALVLAQRDAAPAGERRRCMLVCWAACAAAVLSKGLVGIVLPAAAVALYVLVRRDWRLLGRLELARGTALFLLIAAPWFIAVSLANAEFAHFFFVQEHWQRFSTGMHHRGQPAWYFVPVLVIGAWPWLLPALAGWVSAWRAPPALFSPRLFLALWVLVVFAFYSASGSKLPPYILPIVPSLALLAAAFLAREERATLLLVQALLVAAAALAVGGGALRLVDSADASLYGLGPRYAPWVAGAATLALAGAAGAAFLASVGRGGAAIASQAAALFAALLVGAAGHAVFAPAYSVAQLVAALPQPPSREAAVFALDTYDHSMPWVLRRTVTMVGYRDELAQPIGWEPDGFIPDLAAFARAWRAEHEAYAFIALRDFERVRAELDVPMEVAARGARYVVVRKPQ